MTFFFTQYSDLKSAQIWNFLHWTEPKKSGGGGGGDKKKVNPASIENMREREREPEGCGAWSFDVMQEDSMAPLSWACLPLQENLVWVWDDIWTG